MIEKYKVYQYTWGDGCGGYEYYCNIPDLSDSDIRELISLGVSIEIDAKNDSCCFSTERNSKSNIIRSLDIIDELG